MNSLVVVLAGLLTASPVSETNLVRGVLAVRGHMRHVNKAFATKLVKEAIEVQSRKGNRWFPVHHLLGMAVNESDLRPWLRKGLDCGLTQNRVDNRIFKVRGWHARMKLCKKIAKSSKLSFEYAMLELNHIKVRYCRRYRGRSLLECAHNVYRQGPKFLTRRRCRFRRNVWETAHQLKRRERRCRNINRYWIRGACFAEGIKRGKKARWSCRRALSLGWIDRAYR